MAPVPNHHGLPRKRSQVAGKLESFAHTPGQTPTKEEQQTLLLQSKAQMGVPSVRKSQGQAMTASGMDPAGDRTVEEDTLGLSPRAGFSTEGESSLREVLQTVNACKFSLGELIDQFKSIREELSLVRHDLQKVWERTTTLEGRISLVEDYLNPLKQEIRSISEKVNTCVQNG